MIHSDPHSLTSHDATDRGDAARVGEATVASGDSCDGCAPRATRRYAVPTFRRIAVVRTAGGGEYGTDNLIVGS
jgi:hypothetical protein